MSNIKFYTEEQVKKQKEILEDIIDLWDEGYPLDSNTVNKCKNALLELTPIELPSNEEIEKESSKWRAPSQAFRVGATWVIEQILNQNQ